MWRRRVRFSSPRTKKPYPYDQGSSGETRTHGRTIRAKLSSERILPEGAAPRERIIRSHRPMSAAVERMLPSAASYSIHGASTSGYRGWGGRSSQSGTYPVAAEGRSDAVILPDVAFIPSG